MNQDTLNWASMRSPWEVVDLALNHCSRVYIYGAPSLGKSYIALHQSGVKIFNQTLNGDLSVQELMGMYLPRQQGIEWSNGTIITAMIQGGTLILNELHRASAAVQDFLLSILDNIESCKVLLPSGETITPAAGFKIIATANDGPEVLSPALASRFEVSIHVTTPHPAMISNLNCRIRGLGNLVERSFADSNPISPRAALSYASLVEKGVDNKQAAIAAFGDRGTDVFTLLSMEASK